MADLATLGFAVDSSPLARAKSAMQDMVPAARGAQTATEAMVGAVNGAKAAAEGLAGSAGRAGAGLAAQSATVTRLANEYKQLSDVQRRINATTGVTGLSLGGDRGADIAAYGREMDALRAKFNPLFAAGQQYKATLAEINRAQRVGAISQKEYADAIMNTKAAFTAQVNSIRGVTDRDNFFDKSAEGARRTGKAFQGLSFDARNLSFQLVDVAQGLAMGQSPMMIFAQQAGQIGQIAATSEKGIKGLFAEIGSGIAKVLTPMRLLTVGVLGLGAAIAATVLYWKNYALQLDDVRRIAGTTSSAMTGLNSAAAIKGIGDDEFFGAMRRFSQSAYEARINTGALAPLLRANGVAAGDMRSSFDKVADLVKNAKDDITRINILQQAGLPATRQWIDFMSQGSGAIKLIAAGMKSLGGSDNDRLIEAAKKFDEKWNEIWRNMTNNIKSFGLSVVKAFEDISNSTAFKTVSAAWKLFQTVRAVNSAMWGGGTATTTTPAINPRVTDTFNDLNRSDVANSRISGAFSTLAAYEKTREKASVDAAAAQKRISDAQQRISLLGDLATVDDQVRAKELELSAAWLQSGVSAGKYRDAILNAVRAQAEMSRVQQQASIGVFNLNDANKAAADTLQMWIDKKLLDPNNAQQMAAALNVLSRNTRDMADAAKVAGSNLPGLQQALNDATNVNKMMDQFATSSFNSVTTGLADIFDGTKSAAQGFADLGKTVVRALEEMIIKMYIVAPIFNALKGVLGGGGLLGSILPGVIASANGNVFAANDNGISKYSNQVVSSPTLFAFANGIGLMGEAGAEAIMPLQRGSDGRLGVAANGGTGGGKTEINIVGGGINPNDVEVRQTEDGRGNTRTDIVLDQAVANAMSRSGSQTRKAMANNYGARPVGVRR